MSSDPQLPPEPPESEPSVLEPSDATEQDVIEQDVIEQSEETEQLLAKPKWPGLKSEALEDSEQDESEQDGFEGGEEVEIEEDESARDDVAEQDGAEQSEVSVPEAPEAEDSEPEDLADEEVADESDESREFAAEIADEISAVENSELETYDSEDWRDVEDVFGDGDAAEESQVERVPAGASAIEMVPPGPIRRSLARLLKGLVQLLNWVIVELEAEDIRQRPGAANSLGDRLTISNEELERLTPLRRTWRQVLLNLRSLLPTQLRRISDRNLGLIVATIVVIGGWSVVGDILPKPAKVPEPAIAQVPQEPPVAVTPEPEIPEAPQLPDVVEITPEPEVTPESVSTAEESGASDEDLAEELAEIDGDGNEAESSELALDDGAEELDEPILEMTPEQTLIAAIQGQVVETAQRYGDLGIVQSIQADFRRGRLLVRLDTDQWFDLTALEQDRLAADLFGRSLNLNFDKLEITSIDGVTLARSPVVGDSMVILQRNGAVL
ncbi:MAG: hypothetical protein AAF889_11580 [Cyanobacteria bacterium P01_D01_bin.73]